MPKADPAEMLVTIARLVADAPSLRDVVSRLAVALRTSIPFERLHVLRLDRADSFVLYVARDTGEIETIEHRVGDSATPLDVGDDAARSRLLCTVRQGTRVHGALWVTSSEPGLYGASDQALMDSVVDLLGLAFEHNAIVDREKLRRERIDSLRGLLHTMAGALDIRSIFGEVSDVVRGGLPHDILIMTSWLESGTSFRLYAMAGGPTDEPDLWEPRQLTGDDRAQLNREAYVIHDAEAELSADSIRTYFFRRLGVQSALRVPMPLGGEIFGSLFFLGRQPETFTEDDIDFARRVADHLALALSHQRLADTARSHAESQETAAGETYS